MRLRIQLGPWGFAFVLLPGISILWLDLDELIERIDGIIICEWPREQDFAILGYRIKRCLLECH
jgi:hypothetical protein